MPRSLFSAISGLQSNQQRMDVIADNISNVNTVSFKGSRMSFTNSFTQTLRQASDRQPVGIQFGLGNQISSVATNFNQGAFQRTGIPTDLALSGDGFFVVQDSSGANFVTRDGAFVVDKSGNLITADGNFVRGVVGSPAADPGNNAPGAVTSITIPTQFVGANGNNTVTSFTIDIDGKITLLGSLGDTLVRAYITLAKFSNPQGLDRKGNNLYAFNSAAGSFTGGSTFSETADVRKAGSNGFATMQSGALELSNVDLAEEFTDMIVTQRGFDANARVISTADEMLQTLNTLKR
ncbi:MAG: flagellar hook-basal body complex protein [Verrucomicrobia bacterium]|nr:flagellar hook-basal body complex protein [Verrucomicrobiota bacterium]